MKDILVRLCEIKIEGFKNTQYGLVQMPSVLVGSFFSQKSDILGVYGQNGSGKTAIIEAMDFIQRLLMGRPLPEDTVHFVSKELNHCAITVTFAICIQRKQAKAEYTVEINRVSDEDFVITRESLASAVWNGEKFEKKKKLICFDSRDGNAQFTPNFRYNELVSNNEENKINFGVAKKLAQKERRSFIFNDESRKIFLSASEDATADYAYIINALYRYAGVNLFVISNEHSGSISLNLMLPFAFRLDMGETIAKGDLPIRLDKPSLISQRRYDMVQQIISEMNTVLGTLIPGLSIGVYNLGEQLLENGNSGYNIQLISKRGDVIIPLKYESEGIIKIISILNVLMCVFNDPSMCLIIDELDAGIYEYLLGELLSIFEKSAKGQMIFTSHNLRALEMINKSSILFSTTNPRNRYMRLQNVKTNNNLRDLYLRSITLGGQREEVYSETDTVEIGRAFRRAGKAVLDGGEN
jgi:AAA15 family ATPase/GTPase